jgi:hypothetical protein
LSSVLASAPTWALGWSIAAGAGVAIPVGTGDLQEGVSTGISSTIMAAFGLGTQLEIAGRFTYSHFPRDDDGVLRKSRIEQRPLRILEMSGGALTLVQGQLDLRFFPSQGKTGGALRPFLLASAGLATLDLETAEFLYAYAGHTWPATVVGTQGTHSSLGAGAGLCFDVWRHFRLLCEGRYEIILLHEANARSMLLRLELAFNR